MDKRKELENELQELAPLLRELKTKGDGLSVPKNYFRTLPDQVLEKARKEGLIATPWPIRLARSLVQVLQSLQFALQTRPAIVLAGLAALLVFVGVLFFQPTPPTQTAGLEEVPTEAIARYLNAHIEEIDESLLLSTGLEAGEDLLSSPETSPEDQMIERLLEEVDLTEMEEWL